jgi:hypothetical protein
MNFKWRKSKYSTAEGNCVEVATNVAGIVAARDSKDQDGPVLRFSADTWRRFTDSIKER